MGTQNIVGSRTQQQRSTDSAMDSPTLPHSVFVGAPMLRSPTPQRGSQVYESSSPSAVSFDNIIGSLGFNFKELEKDLALIEADASLQPQHASPLGLETEIAKLASSNEDYLLDQYESVLRKKYMSQSQELLLELRRCEDLLKSGDLDALQGALAQSMKKLDSSTILEIQRGESNTSVARGDNLRLENRRLKLRLQEQEVEIESKAARMKDLTSTALELSIIEAEEINKLEAERKVTDEELAAANAEICRLEGRLAAYEREFDDEVEGRFRYYLDKTQASPLSRAKPPGRSPVKPARLFSEELERKKGLVAGYKKREAELVAALQGVIQRCKELEAERDTL